MTEVASRGPEAQNSPKNEFRVGVKFKSSVVGGHKKHLTLDLSGIYLKISKVQLAFLKVQLTLLKVQLTLLKVQLNQDPSPNRSFKGTLEICEFLEIF